VGVVVVAYAPGPVIERALDAVMSDPDIPVVVVDNSPPDDEAVPQIVARHPSVVLLRHPENLGYCAGNNVGLRALPQTEYVLFLNPDAIVEPGFAAAAAEMLDARSDAAALNPKLLRIDEETWQRTGAIDSAGIFLKWYGRPYNRGQGELDRGQFDGVEEIPAVCGSVLFARRSALDAVADDGAVFDEAFFTHKEDVDLSLRLRRQGWNLLHCPTLVAGHVRGTRRMLASPAVSRAVRRRSLRNEWRILRKGGLPARIAVPMLGYLTVKSLVVRVLTWR
jgi:GT2 family glycosyltransferase